MARRVIPDVNTPAIWRLDELGAVTAVNIANPGTHDGTPANSCAGVDVSSDNMPWDNARQFVRASDQCVNVPHSAALSPTAVISFGCWVKVGAFKSTIQALIYKIGVTSFKGYAVGIGDTTDKNVNFAVLTAAGTRASILTTDGFTPYLGAWVLIVCTYDGQWTRLYISGVEKVAVDHGSVSAILHTDSPQLSLGGWPLYTTEDRYLDGYMAEPFVRSDVMTPWAIKQLYAAVRDPAAGFKL